jgi:hypothetical protein
LVCAERPGKDLIPFYFIVFLLPRENNRRYLEKARRASLLLQSAGQGMELAILFQAD